RHRGAFLRHGPNCANSRNCEPGVWLTHWLGRWNIGEGKPCNFGHDRCGGLDHTRIPRDQDLEGGGGEMMVVPKPMIFLEAGRSGASPEPRREPPPDSMQTTRTSPDEGR